MTSSWRPASSRPAARSYPDSAIGHDHRLCGGGRAVGGQALCRDDVSGFFLSLLYLIYIIGWALLNPKIAPKLSSRQRPGPAMDRRIAAVLFGQNAAGISPGAVISPARALAITAADVRVSYGLLLGNLGFALVPLVMAVGTLWGAWWYVVIYQRQGVEPPPPAAVTQQLGAGTQSARARGRKAAGTGRRLRGRGKERT